MLLEVHKPCQPGQNLILNMSTPLLNVTSLSTHFYAKNVLSLPYPVSLAARVSLPSLPDSFSQGHLSSHPPNVISCHHDFSTLRVTSTRRHSVSCLARCPVAISVSPCAGLLFVGSVSGDLQFHSSLRMFYASIQD